MEVVQSVEQHLHDLLDLRQRELDIDVAQQPSQVVVAEFKHQVGAATEPVVAISFRRNDKFILQHDRLADANLNIYKHTDQTLMLKILLKAEVNRCFQNCANENNGDPSDLRRCGWGCFM